MPDRGEKRVRHLPLLEGAEQMKLRTWVQLVRTVMVVQRRIVLAIGRQGMTLPQFDVLATLRFGDGVTQQALAERLLVTKGNVCGVLDRLEAAGWVERQADPADGRVNLVYLTAAGKRKIDATLPEHDAVVLEAMQGLSPAGVKTLRTSLEEIALSQEE